MPGPQARGEAVPDHSVLCCRESQVKVLVTSANGLLSTWKARVMTLSHSSVQAPRGVEGREKQQTDGSRSARSSARLTASPEDAESDHRLGTVHICGIKQLHMHPKGSWWQAAL